MFRNITEKFGKKKFRRKVLGEKQLNEFYMETQL